METCPITGQRCSEPKNHACGEVVDGVSLSFKLCDKCRNAYLSSSYFLSVEEEARCSQCKWTLTKIKQKGELGCLHCLLTFGEGVLQFIGHPHVEVGRKLVQDRSKTLEKHTKDLKFRLDELVKLEKYEDAAVVRDELKVVAKVFEEKSRIQSELDKCVSGGDLDKCKELQIELAAFVDAFMSARSC